MKIGTSKSLEILKRVFNLTGLLPMQFWRWSSKLYNVYFYLILLFIFVYDVPLLVYLIFVENLEEATYSLSIVLVTTTLFGKFLNFKVYQNGMKNLSSYVEEFQMENSHEMAFNTRQVSLFNKLTFGLYISSNISASCMYIGCLLSNDVILPFLGFYPFDWQFNQTPYVLLFLYQVLGMTLQCNLTVALDLFPSYLMHMASVKLEILGRRIENLSKFQQQGYQNLSMNDESKKRNIVSLVKCIGTYQHIWRYIKLTEQCFTYGLLIHVGCSAAILCSIAYQLTTVTQYFISRRFSNCLSLLQISVRDNVPIYVFMILFLTYVVTQIFIPCYFGNEIIVKHDNLTEKVFKCGWHLQSIEYRRIVIIYMELIKEKKYILVGNWFPLDLNTFTTIMNFSYRLYTLLV